MSLASVPCFLWWFVAGAFAGWLLWWLIDRLFLRNGESAARLSGLESEVQTSKADIARLTGAHAGIQGQLSETQKKLAASTQDLEKYANLEKTYEAEYGKIVTDRDGLKQQLAATAARLSTEHESADAQLVAAHKEAEQLQEQLTVARSQVAAATAETEARSQAIAGLQSELATAKDTAAATASRLEQEHKGAASIQGRIPALESEISQLRADLGAATARIKDGSALSDRLTSELAAHADSRSKLDADANAKLEANARMAKAAEAQIAELKTALAASKGASDDATRLASELAATRAESERTTKELHVAQDWLTRTGTELEASRAAHAASDSEIARLKGQIGELNLQIGSYDKLRKALEAARQAADIGLDLHKTS